MADHPTELSPENTPGTIAYSCRMFIERNRPSFPLNGVQAALHQARAEAAAVAPPPPPLPVPASAPSPPEQLPPHPLYVALMKRMELTRQNIGFRRGPKA
jgi:hypothetical protein